MHAPEVTLCSLCASTIAPHSVLQHLKVVGALSIATLPCASTGLDGYLITRVTTAKYAWLGFGCFVDDIMYVTLQPHCYSLQMFCQTLEKLLLVHGSNVWVCRFTGTGLFEWLQIS